MKKKPVDRVAMKQEATEKVYHHIKAMVIEEELRFWNAALADMNKTKEELHGHAEISVPHIPSQTPATSNTELPDGVHPLRLNR